MSKITYVRIAGKDYPMSFSLGASKKIIEKFGGAQNMSAALKKSKDEEKIDIVIEVLSILIAQGCAYKNYFEKDMPAPEQAPIIDGKWSPLPREVLEIAVDVSDVEILTQKIEECIGTGGKKEYEARPIRKNAEATQG